MSQKETYELVDFNNTNPSIVDLEHAMVLYIWRLIDVKITLGK